MSAMHPKTVTLTPEHSRYLCAFAKALNVSIDDLVECIIFRTTPSNHIDLLKSEFYDDEQGTWEDVQALNDAQADPYDWREFTDLVEL
jgi:hypothetical protein